MIIKWTKLRAICKKIAQKKVSIVLVSNEDWDEHINAFTDKKNIIYLNGNNLKSVPDVIKGVAHELCHILNPELAEKDNQLIQNIIDMEKQISDEYNR